MPWRDAITDSFPPPHEREPGSLRADIRDELADHLECALRREQIKTTDDKAAQKAVLERFGDPKSIARRLWWDAMKGHIMKDRLFLVLFSVGMLALIAAFVMPWAAKQEQINEAILQRLTALTPPPAASRPALPENWAMLKVAVREEGSGRPLERLYVQLVGKPFTDADESYLDESTDAQGLITFGPIRPGPYTARLVTSVDGDLRLSTERSVTLYAGQERQLLLTRPKGGIAVGITPHVNGPEYLQKLGCIAVFDLQRESPIRCEDTSWGVSYVLGMAVEMGGSAWGQFGNMSPGPGPVGDGEMCGFVVSEHSPLRWAAGGYKITKIGVYQPRPAGTPGAGPQALEPRGCWSKVATYETKDLTYNIPAGSFRWELPLPEELLTLVAHSTRLRLPVTCRFADLSKPSDDLLIAVAYSRRELDAAVDDTSSSGGNMLLTATGRSVPDGQFRGLRLQSPPRAGGTPRDVQVLHAPLKTTNRPMLPQGQYELYNFTISRKVEDIQGLAAWENCGQYSMNINKPSEKTQRLEVRAGQENAWSIQLPPELLKKCDPAAAATTTQPP